jgi:hypothetical protein
MALFVGLGLIVVAVYGFAADERDSPRTPASNAFARSKAARKVYEDAMQHRLQVPESKAGDISYLHDWSVRWMQAEKDFGPAKKSAQIAACEGHLKRMQSCKEAIDAEVRIGTTPRHSATAAEFFRLEAEDWLAAARAEGK